MEAVPSPSEEEASRKAHETLTFAAESERKRKEENHPLLVVFAPLFDIYTEEELQKYLFKARDMVLQRRRFRQHREPWEAAHPGEEYVKPDWLT